MVKRITNKLHATFHRPTTRAYKLVEALIWVLIAFSLVPLALEMGAPLTPAQRHLLELVDWVILVCFAIELTLRVLSYRPPQLDTYDRGLPWRGWIHITGRLRFCLHPLLLIDLLAVLAIVPALRTLRALRLLRLLRTVKVFRYSQPFLSLLRSLHENALLYLSAITLLLLAVIAAGISFYLTERAGNAAIRSVADGIWWALVTVTTVGYGDIAPVTGVGRLIGIVLMLAGMFTLALFAGIVGSTLIKVVLQLRQEQFLMSSRVNHVVVCGYDAGARMLIDALLEELAGEQRDLLVFASGERPPDLPAQFIWISGDPTKESELDKVRLAAASSVIVVGARDRQPQLADATTILVVFTIRAYLKGHPEAAHRKVPVFVAAEILDSENVVHARAAGADEVIETTRLGFSLLAHSVTEHGAGEIMTSVATAGAHSLYISPYPFDDQRAYADLARTLRERHQITLLGVRDPTSGAVQLSPEPQLLVDPGCEVIYLGREAVLDHHE